MLRWVILAVLVVVLAATATLVVQSGNGSSQSWNLPAAPAKVGPQPHVDVENPLTHEFGQMSTQKVGKRTGKVKNTGEGDLQIWLLGSTCTCTIPKLKGEGARETIKPGESTEVELEWKTKDSVGEFAKGATIGSNDPSRPEFMLHVHGMVYPPIVIKPEPHEGVVPIGDISNDQNFVFQMAVYSPDRPETKITKLTTSKPDMITAVTIPFTKQDQAQLNTKGGFRVKLDLKPGLPVGPFREELILETDHPDMPRTPLVLTGNASGPIGLMPTVLRMVAVNGRQGGSGQLTLLVREGRPTTFKTLRKPDKLEVAVTPNDTPTLKGRYRVTVTVPPGTPPGVIEDEVILETDHPKVRELKIPVSISVGSG